MANSHGVKTWIEGEQCSIDPGGLLASGTVTNPTGEAEDVVITVSWTGEGNRVLARGEYVVKGLEGGASEAFSIAPQAESDGLAITACTVGASAGTLA